MGLDWIRVKSVRVGVEVGGVVGMMWVRDELELGWVDRCSSNKRTSFQMVTAGADDKAPILLLLSGGD